jgi:hypothetical protein
MKPTPKLAITRFGAGVHSFWKAEKDLPVGIVPSVIKSWNEAGAERVLCSVGLYFHEALPVISDNISCY